jgi:hypothetical protein
VSYIAPWVRNFPVSWLPAPEMSTLEVASQIAECTMTLGTFVQPEKIGTRLASLIMDVSTKGNFAV